MLELSMNQIMKHMGTTLILKDVNFSVYEGVRVGVIGANGCGKSTLLKLLAGIIKLKLFSGSWSPGYDFGFISMPRHAKVAYLDQTPYYEAPYTVKEVLYLAFKETLQLEKTMRDLEQQMTIASDDKLESVMKKYSRIVTEYETLGGYDIQEKAAKVCTGLGFDDTFLNQKFDSLSGGEKTTVELGKLLIHQPDILLLDEPTNHLDADALEWLEEFLKQYKGIIMIVSHDRYFLDQVTNKILEIEDLTTTMYKGNFSKYKYQKDELLRIQAADYKEQQKLIKTMKKQVHDLRQWAMQSDNNKFFQRAASIQIKLDKLTRIKRPVFDRRNMQLSFLDDTRTGKETIIATNVCKSFGDKCILDNASTLIRYGERVALLGPNGSGKSTLLKMLLQECEVDSGKLKVGAGASVAYLPQEISFQNESLTVLETFKEDIVIEAGAAREYLSKFMFYGKSVFTEVKGLSGGERIRLKLALLLYNEVNLLILDEPTNHLDIDSIETLENALKDFSGSIFFVSHDRYFINNISDRTIAIEDHQLIPYENYKAYRDQPVLVKIETKKIKEKKIHITNRNFEQELEALEKSIVQLDEEMLLNASDHSYLNKLYLEKCSLTTAVEDICNEWLLDQTL